MNAPDQKYRTQESAKLAGVTVRGTGCIFDGDLERFEQIVAFEADQAARRQSAGAS